MAKFKLVSKLVTAILLLRELIVLLNENGGSSKKTKLPITGMIAGAVALGTKVIQGSTGSTVNGFVENRCCSSRKLVD